MRSMVRAAALRGLESLVDRLGGDGAELLGRFRVPRGALDAEDAVIPSVTAGRLLETAAAELGCPDLGLRLAEQQNADVLGPLAVAIENSQTMGDALDCASRFLFVHSPALTVTLVPDPQGIPGVRGLRYGSTEPVPLPPQAIDLGLGLLHRIITLLYGGRYGLHSVHLPHAPLAPVSRYTEFFGADVRFGRDAAVLRLPAAFVDTPLQGGNEMLRAIAVEFLEGHFPEPGRLVAPRVRAALSQSLGSAQVRVDAVARLLQLNPRTLQRYLAAEGTTFEAVLDDVRRQTAHRLIIHTDLPFSQVAAMLGFAEQSGLTRAVRRWYGRPPREVRRRGDARLGTT
jgi:AraC-like DNA-binding protein